MIKKMVVIGYGARGQIYALFAKNHPDMYQLVGVVENNEDRIELAKRVHLNVPVFSDYKDFLNEKISADLAVIATQDEQHKEHAIAMMKAGYDLLLEKPIATTKEDCLEIYKTSLEYNRKVVVCHVLRYSPFYSQLKSIIDSGKIGDVVTINASENVGYYHQAHSFVRGPWKNSIESSPMILAKCCHDMDIIRYLMGEDCVSVNSYGDLYYFNEKHAPKDSAVYCSECKHTDCIYKAQTIYLSDYGRCFSGYFNDDEQTNENILKNLKGTNYDKCVFKSNNDVVDHQVTIMQFKNGKTACHTMTAFSKDIYRDIKIHATKAELVGKMEDNYIEIRYFGGDVEKINIDTSLSSMGGHGGSDFFMMNSLYEVLNGNVGKGITFIDVSIESHLMCFAAEESRLNHGSTIIIKK